MDDRRWTTDDGRPTTDDRRACKPTKTFVIFVFFVLFVIKELIADGYRLLTTGQLDN